MTGTNVPFRMRRNLPVLAKIGNWFLTVRNRAIRALWRRSGVLHVFTVAPIESRKI
jgi:hypothetical protein